MNSCTKSFPSKAGQLTDVESSTCIDVVEGWLLVLFQLFDKFQDSLFLPLAGSSAVAGTLARAASTVLNLGPLATLAFDLS